MQFLKLLLACMFLTGSGYASANHAAGGYFQYACLGNGQYQVDFFFLRDCDGLDYPESLDFSIRNSCQTNCSDLTVTAPLVESSQVNYGCGTGCDSPDGFQLAQYRSVITFPYFCADWTITVSIDARNSVSYADYIGSADYFNYCIINNTNAICNNSVQVSGPPFAIGCTGNSGRSLYTLTSPVGNALVYDFVTPKTGDCAQSSDVNFHSGASTLRPFPSSSNFILAQDGTFTFSPTAQGANYFAVRIREYANNILVGTTVIDGIIIARACSQGGMISFSDWANDDDNTYTVSGVGQDHCRTIILTPNEANGDVANVTVTGPYLGGYEVLHLPDGKAAVTICVQFPEEVMCPEVDALLIVTAQTAAADCFSHVLGSGASTGYYHVVKQRGEYCPDNLYFTNRSPTGNPMPAYARAEERIWVGDDMPPGAPFEPSGPVIALGNVELVAGIEVILPSCVGGPNAGCVTITGNSTIKIDSFACNSDCYQEPITFTVEELFRCGGEKLIAHATGEAPFSYHWVVNGAVFNTTSNELAIHDIVSALNTGAVPYSCDVMDAVGGTAHLEGFVLGTYRFYQPVVNNTIYFNYNDDDLYEDGYYYPGQPGCDQYRPFFINDLTNSSPPWYGATRISLRIMDRWHIQEYFNITLDLESPDNYNDWSFDNGQFYWNSHPDNDLGEPCTQTGVFNYVLDARNCYTLPHIEESALIVHECFMNEWIVPQSKSTLEDDYSDKASPDSLSRMFNQAGYGLSTDFLQIYPNPAKTSIQIQSNQKELLSVRITDQKGIVIMEFTNLAANIPISIEKLSAGIYTVQINDQHLKLVKE